jgi:formate hydrogenlyase subunit 3/multisubunit Na+/H+ antiporter MnhD subunit
MTIITIVAILGFLLLFWIHINTFFIRGGGRYSGFPNPVAVISVIQTIILGVCFMYSQDYMKKV